MYTIATADRIASAHAVLWGRYGDVTRLARDRGASRQRLYREAKAVAVALGPDRDTALAGLRQRLAEAQADLGRLRQQLGQAVAWGPAKLDEFAATAQAEGVSLPAARALLAVLLGRAAPSVAALGRRAHEAGRKASGALAVLDEFARPRARQVAADELHVGRKPVLMTVEQHSLCWLGGRLAPSRDGDEWAKEFDQLPAAEQVTRDGGQGMEKGLELSNDHRRQAGEKAVADQEDHFHILHRGRRGLRAVKAKAVAAFRKAEKADKELVKQRRQGRVPGVGSRVAAVNRYWRQAEQAFDRWSAHDRAFARLRAALRLYTPEGRLNTPARAQVEVEAALVELDGPEWSRLKHGLVGPKAFTFLGRAHQQLEALPVEPELREAAVRLEGLLRQPEALPGDTEAAGALRGVMLACAAVLGLARGAGAEALALVRGVLCGAWRSSSLVESLNGALRMHQRRHKRLTQGLLDLKRLRWNAHVFVAGKRKRDSPYGLLGLKLPPGGWWPLIQMTPEQLRQQLSALNPAA